MKHGHRHTMMLFLIILLGMFMLSGCTKEAKLSSPTAKEVELQQRVAEMEKQLKDLSLTKESKSAGTGFEEMEKVKQLLSWYERTVTKLTHTLKPEYEILKSNGAETVVFVKNAPDDYESRGIFLLRMALEFPEGEKVAFWRDLNAAKEYSERGIANEDDKHMFMLGRIHKVNDKWTLEQFGSTSGPSRIRFGKFESLPE